MWSSSRPLRLLLRRLASAPHPPPPLLSAGPRRHLQHLRCLPLSRPEPPRSPARLASASADSQWRPMSSYGGAKGTRSKVFKRMMKETGRDKRERRRAVRLRKKLMTEEERVVYSLRKAKKKVSLLLQKLKKYELPELPSPRHDPELLTSEQLQAYKKIGYKNKNYVPVGVRGVFGGVVQNMHLHWKFHETVQVCCDNYPKEKIKEMATMLARLSGGIVVNIHNVNTIIMFRGRNYRQPKILIPMNTLTKRKALFKARFEQALESQKLNIKSLEQKIRRMGINPEDPVAMASIQKVASTFFNAIDEKQDIPFGFHEEKNPPTDVCDTPEGASDLSGEDTDQEELDRFIAEIEEAADRDWAAEEAAEKEESTRIRYWNKEGRGMHGSRSLSRQGSDSDDDVESHLINHDKITSRYKTVDVYNWNNGNEISESEDDYWEPEEEADSDTYTHGDGSSDRMRSGKHDMRRSNFRMNASGSHMPGKAGEGETDGDVFSESEDEKLWYLDKDEPGGLNLSKGDAPNIRDRGPKDERKDVRNMSDRNRRDERKDVRNIGSRSRRDDRRPARNRDRQSSQNKNVDDSWDND